MEEERKSKGEDGLESERDSTSGLSVGGDG